MGGPPSCSLGTSGGCRLAVMTFVIAAAYCIQLSLGTEGTASVARQPVVLGLAVVLDVPHFDSMSPLFSRRWSAG